MRTRSRRASLAFIETPRQSREENRARAKRDQEPAPSAEKQARFARSVQQADRVMEEGRAASREAPRGRGRLAIVLVVCVALAAGVYIARDKLWSRGPAAPTPAACVEARAGAGIRTLGELPRGRVEVDFEACGACACCTATGLYPDPSPDSCDDCAAREGLRARGVQVEGDVRPTKVARGNIGSDAAPMEHRALEIQSADGTARLTEATFRLDKPADAFGASFRPVLPRDGRIEVAVTMTAMSDGGTAIETATLKFPDGARDPAFLGVGGCGRAISFVTVRVADFSEQPLGVAMDHVTASRADR